MSAIFVYLICPVRRATPVQEEAMRRYVENLEDTGLYVVHWPQRDVDQSLPDSAICLKHGAAMSQVDEVHVWVDWDPVDGQRLSEGSLFDLGMAFALFQNGNSRMKFKVANPPLHRTKHKSFLNVLQDLSDGRIHASN